MNKPIKLSIGATSKRVDIANIVGFTFFNNVALPPKSELHVVMGWRDSELGGTGPAMLVGRKKYDFGFGNPVGLAAMAYLGRGFYKYKIPLRAIGVFPTWDRLIFAVRQEKLAVSEQTKPTLVENKDRKAGEESTFRFHLDPPMEPIEAIHRRIGKYLPPPEPEKREHVMIWVDKNGSEWMRTDDKPLKMHDGTYLPDMRTYIDSKKYNPEWITPEERAKLYAPPKSA